MRCPHPKTKQVSQGRVFVGNLWRYSSVQFIDYVLLQIQCITLQYMLFIVFCSASVQLLKCVSLYEFSAGSIRQLEAPAVIAATGLWNPGIPWKIIEMSGILTHIWMIYR